MKQGLLLAECPGEDTVAQLWRDAAGRSVVVVRAAGAGVPRIFKEQPLPEAEARRLFALPSWEKKVAEAQAFPA